MKTLPTFYGTREFITAITNAHLLARFNADDPSESSPIAAS